MGRKLLLFLLLCLGFLQARASHLVGGDFSFECQGNNRYSFTLTVYRDVLNPNGAGHDNPAYIFVYDLDDNLLYNTYSASLSNTPTVQNNDLGPCLQNPDPPVIDYATYRYNNVFLPVNGRGYRIVYQRCCRSGDAQNLALNPDGFQQGSTYEIIIRPNVLNECDQPNPLPELQFEELPPTQWCANEAVSVDQAVNDDILTFVDSVVYSLCAPFEGGSGSNCVIPDPFTAGDCNDFNAQCSEPCAYGQVVYGFGYNALQPMGTGSSIDINPNTGLLTVEPSTLGVFVVAICATAWKDGEVYNTVSRDYSFKVFDCIADGAEDPIALNGNAQAGTVVDSIGPVDAVYLVCDKLEVDFQHNSSTTVLNYYWDFGVPGTDSDTSLSQFPSYTYPDTGTYLVTFIVNRNAVCVDTARAIVRVFPTFEPAFQAEVGCFTLPVEFTDTSLSTLSNNPVIDWFWDFGDGNTATGTPNPQHTYGASGNYTATLIMETALGCRDTTTRNIFAEPSPEADLDNFLACTGMPHQFQNLSDLNGTELDFYSWDFGDGSGFSVTSADVDAPPQTYADSGVYDIQLIASSTNGCSDTARAQLTVAEQVVPDFVFNPANVCPGQEIQFQNTTVQYYDSLYWVIGGMTLYGENPVFTYNTPGPKTVELHVFSNGICGDVLQATVDVAAGPFADFEVDSTCTGTLYPFVNNSVENGITIDSFIWDFGDGTTMTADAPVHQYTAEGDFTVTLIAMTNLACKDTAVMIIPVKEGIVPDFTFGPDTICETITSAIFENISTGTSWDSVVWNYGDGSGGYGEITEHVYQQGGFYDVEMGVYDDICGENLITRTIEILHIPQPDIPDSLNICDGIIEVLRIDNEDGYLVYWSTGDSLVNSIAIDNSPDSVIVLVNNRGCMNSDMTVITRDCPAYLPNTFTPNGDGVNDRFGPLPFNITSFTLNVYNRWGELVFSTTDYDGWDGTYKGGPAPMDTYVYTFQGIGLDDKILNQFGTITILR